MIFFFSVENRSCNLPSAHDFPACHTLVEGYFVRVRVNRVDGRGREPRFFETLVKEKSFLV